jgi:hypothetical protein
VPPTAAKSLITGGTDFSLWPEWAPAPSVDSFLETRSGAYFAGTDRGLSQFMRARAATGSHAYRQGADRFDKPVNTLWNLHPAGSGAGRRWDSSKC